MKTIIKLFRIHHWVKNLLCFAPLVFSEHLLNLQQLAASAVAFACFCLLSSSTYIVNDIFDLEEDRQHPHKKNRPIAAGLVSVRNAAIIATVLLFASLYLSFRLKPVFSLVLVIYIAIESLYTMKLKGVVILDVFCISAGFILRVLGGYVVIGLVIAESNWLFICAGLLALFLGFSKRRSELENHGEDAATHRRVLSQYNAYYLDQMMLVAAIATLVIYMVYALSATTIAKFGIEFALTIPFVFYGLFRYQFLIYHQTRSREDPIMSLFFDRPLLVACLLWISSVLLIIFLRSRTG